MEQTVKELIAKKKKFERELLEDLRNRIDEFENDCGIGIKNISLPMADVTTWGDDCRKLKLAGVEIDLDLDLHWI